MATGALLEAPRPGCRLAWPFTSLAANTAALCSLMTVIFCPFVAADSALRSPRSPAPGRAQGRAATLASTAASLIIGLTPPPPRYLVKALASVTTTPNSRPLPQPLDLPEEPLHGALLLRPCQLAGRQPPPQVRHLHSQ